MPVTPSIPSVPDVPCGTARQEVPCSPPKTQNHCPKLCPGDQTTHKRKSGRKQSEQEAEREDEGKKVTSRVIRDDAGSRWMAEGEAEKRTRLRSSLSRYDACVAAGQWALLPRAGSGQVPREGRPVLPLSPGSLWWLPNRFRD